MGGCCSQSNTKMLDTNPSPIDQRQNKILMQWGGYQSGGLKPRMANGNQTISSLGFGEYSRRGGAEDQHSEDEELKEDGLL